MGRLSLKVVPGSSRDEVVAIDSMDDDAIWAAFSREKPGKSKGVINRE